MSNGISKKVEGFLTEAKEFNIKFKNAKEFIDAVKKLAKNKKLIDAKQMDLDIPKFTIKFSKKDVLAAAKKTLGIK